MRRDKKMTYGEWEAEYNERVTKHINEEFARISEAIMKQHEPEPKLITDRLKQAHKDAAALKKQVGNHIELQVNSTGIEISQINSYCNQHIQLTSDELLQVRDWMTTILGEDKVIEKHVANGQPFMIPVSTPSCEGSSSIFTAGIFTGAAGVVGMWLLIQFFLR